jgi:hypothetical protein
LAVLQISLACRLTLYPLVSPLAAQRLADRKTGRGAGACGQQTVEGDKESSKTSEEQLERTGLETCSAVVVAVKEGKNG